MKYIISGTDRPGSNTLKLSKFIQNEWAALGEQVEIIDLQEISKGLREGPQYGDPKSPILIEALQKVLHSEGLIVVAPEYNGSMPGVLKLFIDHLQFPQSFEYRPVCFIGLGGMFGALRPVEHLQGVFGYRNAFIYPERVFVTEVWKAINDQGIQNEMVLSLIKKQAKGFKAFCAALSGAGLDANSFLKK